MSFSTAYLALMPHTITVSTLSGVSTDGYGTATFTTGTAYSSREVGKQHVVRSLAGIEETATTVVYIASTSTFPPSAQFTLNDGVSQPELLAVEAYPDSDGIHHIKASFA